MRDIGLEAGHTIAAGWPGIALTRPVDAGLARGTLLTAVAAVLWIPADVDLAAVGPVIVAIGPISIALEMIACTVIAPVRHARRRGRESGRIRGAPIGACAAVVRVVLEVHASIEAEDLVRLARCALPSLADRAGWADVAASTTVLIRTESGLTAVFDPAVAVGAIELGVTRHLASATHTLPYRTEVVGSP